MKKGIHPTWHHDCQVTCSCGNVFTIGSVSPSLTIDICDKCHPYFTGELKFVDRQGRVDRFKKKVQAAQDLAQIKKPVKKSKKATKSSDDHKSYKDILRDQQSQLRKTAKAPKTAEATLTNASPKTAPISS